ncbi:MAG: hypothetical protein FWC70_13300 [Defluviitaleaceae bacterium]|nr:hypothetical protein [Defluviitaleaceae bacterium]
MDKLDYAILEFLQNHATTKMSAKTRKEIRAEFAVKADTLYRRIKGLIENGSVTKGIIDGRSHTYFITKSGIEKLREAMK